MSIMHIMVEEAAGESIWKRYGSSLLKLFRRIPIAYVEERSQARPDDLLLNLPIRPFHRWPDVRC